LLFDSGVMVSCRFNSSTYYLASSTRIPVRLLSSRLASPRLALLPFLFLLPSPALSLRSSLLPVLPIEGGTTKISLPEESSARLRSQYMPSSCLEGPRLSGWLAAPFDRQAILEGPTAPYSRDVIGTSAHRQRQGSRSGSSQPRGRLAGNICKTSGPSRRTLIDGSESIHSTVTRRGESPRERDCVRKGGAAQSPFACEAVDARSQNTLLLQIEIDALGHDIALSILHLHHSVLLGLLILALLLDLLPQRDRLPNAGDLTK
jgi:hypothetical protein